MAKNKGVTRKGGPEQQEIPDFIETERSKELEALAAQEQADWGEDVQPLKPGDEDDIPPEARVEEDELDREEITSQLQELGVKVDGRKSTENLNELLQKSLEDKGETDDKPDEGTDDKPDGAGGDDKPDDTGEDDPDKSTDDKPEDDYDTLVVGGVETKTERSKIYDAGKQALQKTLYADKKMQEATEKAKEADQILTEARKKAEELAKPPEPERKDKSEDTGKPSMSDEDVSDIIDNIRYGNSDQAKEAVLKMVSLGAKNATPQKPQEVEPIIDQRFDELFNKRAEIQAFESALEQAKRPPEKGGFGDVFDGGPREKVFEYYEGQFAKDEPTLSYLERFEKAGTATRQALNLNPTKQGSPESDSRSQRKAELENSHTATSPGSAKPDPKPAKTEFEHHNQLLSEIQKGRRGR